MTTAHDLLHPSIKPGALSPIWNGNRPDQIISERAADLPELITLPTRHLMPSMPMPIWTTDEHFGNTDTQVIREQTRNQIKKMDWQKIEKGKSVHLLANPHGFALCGEAYVVMLEEIALHLQQTREARIKLRIAESMGHVDNPDWVSIYDLDNRFDDVIECQQCSAGTKIDTKLGDMYVVKKIFNAPYFVHTHVTEMREGYLHRMLDRLHKPFGMSYARLETRSAWHFGYGPRTGQMVGRAIFDSEFIQNKHAGTVVLNTSSEGVVSVEGDNDLDALNKRLTKDILLNYGALMRLLGEIKACIPIFDHHGCSFYTYGGGINFSNLLYADTDFLDLDNFALNFGTLKKSAFESGFAMSNKDAIKSIVINYMAGGVPSHFMFKHWNLHFSNEQTYKWLINEPSNCYLESLSSVHNGLNDAIHAAILESGCEELFAFDGTPGAFRLTQGLADTLLNAAPRVIRDVEENLLPKWLRQRQAL